MPQDEAYLALDGFGSVEGRTRSSGAAFGEVVFTTAYTGYEESITDPSYSGQILIFSYPLIGNYGVREERFESGEPQVEAVVARELTDDVADWLQEHDIPAIDRVDTRSLVTYIRDEGAVEAALTHVGGPSPHDPESGWTPPEHYIRATPDFADRKDYIQSKTRLDQSVVYEGGGPSIGFIDCGAKKNILDEFLARDAHLIRYPHDVDPTTVRYDDPDLLFVSNGPGDPEWFEAVQHTVCRFAGELPMAGICLGQQVIALALGGDTEKMKFGHHGINQPVIHEETEHVKMTTQNHGYEVADPGELTVVERNVNDGSAEGLRSEELDILTRQYHPEACPGPRDSKAFFDRVLALAD